MKDGAAVSDALLFQAFFEQAAVGVAVIDAVSGCFLRINRKYAEIVGYSVDEMLHLDFQAITHPDDLAADLANMERLRGGLLSSFVMEKRYVHKDGRVVWVKLTVSPLWQPGSPPGCHIAVVDDISEHKQAEMDLRHSEERMRSFFENVPVGIFITIPEGKFEYVNTAMSVIFGYDSCEELMETVNRRSTADVLYVDPLQRQKLIQELDSNEARWMFYEGRYLRKDGRVIDADIEIRKNRDSLSGKVSYYGILSDTTERKRIEKELRAAKLAAESASLSKTRFLAAASHDLRQPLQAICLFHEAIGNSRLNVEQSRLHHYMSQSVASLGQILDALLDISKLDAGIVVPSISEIQIDSIFKKIDADFARMAIEKSLRFKLHFPQWPMTVSSDATLLLSMLSNLVGNAIKYTERGGLLVGVRRRGRQALFQVRDTGIGIGAAHMDSIFEEYFQVGNPERDRTKGLGLGLSIVRRLARLLNTDVTCRSWPGKGSVFEFCLPLVEGSPIVTPGRVDAERHQPVERERRHVVVVEEDRMVARALALSLESLGMRITIYESAEDALANSERNAGSFYICDFRLPGMNGIQMLETVQHAQLPPVKAVVLTGETSPELIGLTRTSRWTVLHKPVDLSKLVSVIEEADENLR